MADTFLNNKLKLPKDQALKPAKISNKPVSQKDPMKQAQQIQDTSHKDFAKQQATQMKQATTGFALKKGEEKFYVLDEGLRRLNTSPMTMEEIGSRFGDEEERKKKRLTLVKVTVIALTNEHGQPLLKEQEDE